MLRMASTFADRIVQRRGHVMPLVLMSVPRRHLGTKFSSPLERIVVLKSYKVDYAAKVVLRPTPIAAETDSSAGKEETARMGSF